MFADGHKHTKLHVDNMGPIQIDVIYTLLENPVRSLVTVPARVLLTELGPDLMQKRLQGQHKKHMVSIRESLWKPARAHGRHKWPRGNMYGVF